MSWSTDLFCNIIFNKETFNSLYEVEDKINSLDRMIEYNKNTLRDLAFMTEPNKMLNLEEGESILYKIKEMVEEALEELEDYYIEKWKLEMLKENWLECHNEEGLAIEPPEGINWKTAFLSGDFVKSVQHPNGYE